MNRQLNRSLSMRHRQQPAGCWQGQAAILEETETLRPARMRFSAPKSTLLADLQKTADVIHSGLWLPVCCVEQFRNCTPGNGSSSGKDSRTNYSTSACNHRN